MTVTSTPTGQDLVCLVCGTDKDIDIDHVQAKGMGGSKERDVPENKTPLCRPCHDAKHRHVLETRVKDGFFEWRKRGGGVWIKVPVEVSQRYRCWVQKEVMPNGVPDTAMREMRNKPLSDGQRVEEGEEAGRLSDGAEARAVTPEVSATSAPSLSKEESQWGSGSGEGAPAKFGTMQKISRRTKEESDGESVSSTQRQAATGGAAKGDSGGPSVGVRNRSGMGDSDGSLPADSTGLTHEQRVAIAQQIHDTEWSRQWIAGDTANAWRAELGEEAEQYICDFGYVQESIANIMYVCETIPKNIRRAGLRFSHHVVMLGLNREDMEMWLDKCEEEQWSVAEFRRQVKGAKPRTKRWPMEELLEGLEAWRPTDRPRPKGAVRAYLTWLGEQG